MKSQYQREYYDFLQNLSDQADELNLREERKERARQRKLRQLSRVLTTLLLLSKDEAEAFYKQYFAPLPEWKPITNLLFPISYGR